MGLKVGCALAVCSAIAVPAGLAWSYFVPDEIVTTINEVEVKNNKYFIFTDDGPFENKQAMYSTPC